MPTPRQIIGIVGCLALAGCRAPTVEEPLFDTLHAPLVLTESQEIAPPASQSANRFVRGWRDVARRGRPRLAARPGATIQGVHLADRSRVLRLGGVSQPAEGELIEVRVADGEWFTQPLTGRLRIPLPENLPFGRFSVDLRLPEGTSLQVKRATFSQALPAGEVRVGERSLVQSGHSLVETVRRLDSKSFVTGEFRPPNNASASQRFSIRLQRNSGLEETVFEWVPGAKTTGPFEIPIDEDDGWVRIRFLAQGEGPPARWSDLAFHRRPAREPETVTVPQAPQIVILYVMDALRSDFVGHLGGQSDLTPTIDRLAREGGTFRSHFSIAPNTVPSMKSLLSGQVFLFKGGLGLDPASGPTLAERFVEAGYRTALFSGNGNVSQWRGMGRGYELVSSGALWQGDRNWAEAGYNNNAEVVHRTALDFIASRDPDEKLFLHLQTIHPHNPYAPPEPYLSRFTDGIDSEIDGRTRTLLGIKRLQIAVSEVDQQRLRALYAGGVAYNDAHLESFLNEVLERYPREEVLLVLTSDHGEELFEHGGVLHGYTLYDEMLRIPLVVWWPGTVVPVEVDPMTDTLDLYASLASLAAQGEPISGGGRDLWAYLTGARSPRTNDREVLFSAASAVRGGIFMARSPRYKLILAPRLGSRGGNAWGMGQGRGRSYDPEYLFDLVGDPRESTNLAGADILEADWLRSRLDAWITAGEAIESGAALDEMDEATQESLRALGYVQ